MNVYYMRRRGVPLVLSSLSQENAEKLDSNLSFTVLSSSPLGPDEKDDVYRSLLSDSHIVLLKWIGEKRYIPRLFASAFLFIVVYFILSVVIPDPVPVVDELVFAFIASALLWVLLSRMDEKSQLMKERNKAVEDAVLDSDFATSSDMRDIEEYYDSLYSYSLLETAWMIAEGRCKLSSSLSAGWKDDFTAALFLHLKASDKGIMKTIKRCKEGQGEKTVRFLVHQVTIGGLDILDLALYFALTDNNLT